MKMTCEIVRDRVPDLEAGVLEADEALEMERHFEECPACADERAVVDLVRASAPEPPAGLEARIREAVRTPPAGVALRQRSVPSFAVAAGIVFVLLAGGLLMQNGVLPGGSAESPPVEEVTFGWPHVSDPILRTAPVFSGLSVEELESLLAELES